MKILLPTSITNNLSSIQTITLNINNYSIPLAPETLALGSLGLHDDVFQQASNLIFSIKSVTGEISSLSVGKNKVVNSEDLRKYASTRVEALTGIEYKPTTLMRKNTNTPYEDTEQVKWQLLDEVKAKALTVKNITTSKNIRTGKNLLYYVVFGGDDYVSLLVRSINSLGDAANFDILVFTDDSTKQKIVTTLGANNRAVTYKIVPTPIDGVDASKVKTTIFEYEKINDYEKILYLDADTIITKNISEVFSLNLQYNKLYTAYNKNLILASHKISLYHGFAMISDADYAIVTDNKEMPFNAGQFLFKNSTKMKLHFENVNWFMQNWPGEYFFEQAFMNYYFCVNVLTNSIVFDKKVKLIPTGNLRNAETGAVSFSNMTPPNASEMILHFIGPALNAKVKLEHIDNYVMVNNI
jgi:hypothetical protein